MSGGFKMNKDEILEKSRREKKDEGIEYAMNNGRRLGTVGMSIMFVILLVYNLLKGIDSDALHAVFWTYIGLDNLGRYRITKEKSLLIGAVAGTLAGVLFFVTYILGTVR